MKNEFIYFILELSETPLNLTSVFHYNILENDPVACILPKWAYSALMFDECLQILTIIIWYLKSQGANDAKVCAHQHLHT